MTDDSTSTPSWGTPWGAPATEPTEPVQQDAPEPYRPSPQQSQREAPVYTPPTATPSYAQPTTQLPAQASGQGIDFRQGSQVTEQLTPPPAVPSWATPPNQAHPTAQLPAWGTAPAAVRAPAQADPYASAAGTAPSGYPAGHPSGNDGWPPAGLEGAPAWPSDGKPAKARTGRGLVVVAVLCSLLAGGIGVGVGAAIDGGSSSKGTAQSTLTSSSGTAPLTAAASGSQTVATAAAAVLPSVVTISVLASNGSGDTGSGIVLDTAGHILTNNHVVAAVASGDKLTVTDNDGNTVDATVVGTDQSSDLAVIQVSSGASSLKPATLGASSKLVVGQEVVAVGAPLGLAGTVTSGIVSALNRPVATGDSASSEAIFGAVQTDAAINPGNSGGALVDLNGAVIGINSAIASTSDSSSSSAQSGNIGVGFAIPIDSAKDVAQQIIANGSAVHPILGVGIDQNTTGTGTGAALSSVTAGGPADKAGLQVGDVITKLGDTKVIDYETLFIAIRNNQPNSTVTVTYTRDGQTATAQVTLGSRKG